MLAFSWLYFSGRINTYQPITVRNDNNESVDFTVYGTTPLGRVFAFIQRDSIIASCYYSFCKQIEICFNKNSKTKYHNVIIEIGDISYHYNIIDENTFIKPSQDRGDANYFRALFSLFHWHIVKLFFSIIASIIIICLIWFYLPKLFSLFKFLFNNLSIIFISSLKILKILINYLKNVIYTLYLFVSKIPKLFYNLILKYIHYILIVFVILLYVFCLYYFMHLIEKSAYNIFAGLFFIVLIGSTLYLLFFIIFSIFNIKKSIKHNIYLLLFILFLSLIGTELLLRKVVKRYDTYQERNGMSYMSCYNNYINSWFFVHAKHLLVKTPYKEYTFQSFTNNEGLSDKDFVQKKDSNEYRILTIGDSFTEGFGTSTDSCWTRLLEHRMKNYFKNKNINILNAGIGGSDVCYEYMLLKHRLLKYKPNKIIVALNSSDIPDVIIRGGMERFNTDTTVSYRKAPRWEWIYAISYIYRHIAHDILGYDYVLIKKKQLIVERSIAVNKIINCIKLIKNLADDNNIKLLIVLHPESVDLILQQNPFGEKIQTFCNKNGIDCTNLYEYYTKVLKMNKNNINNYFWKIDTHHNGRGYDAFAEGVFLKLKDSLLLNK